MKLKMLVIKVKDIGSKFSSTKIFCFIENALIVLKNNNACSFLVLCQRASFFLKIFNHRNGDRPDAADVLILFTDGRAHDFKLAKKHAARMKERNIKIITIAAGHEAKNPKAKLVKQLEEIASDPLNVYKVDFSELGEITDRLIHVDCVIVPQKI